MQLLRNEVVACDENSRTSLKLRLYSTLLTPDHPRPPIDHRLVDVVAQ